MKNSFKLFKYAYNLWTSDIVRGLYDLLYVKSVCSILNSKIESIGQSVELLVYI